MGLEAARIPVSVAALTCLFAAACNQKPAVSPQARFDGVTAASGVTFTSSPSRCAISFLYDDFRLEWLANEERRGSPEQKSSSRHIVLAVSPAAQGKTILLDIRGGATPGARLAVRVAEQSFEVPLPAAGEFPGFYHRVEAKLSTGGKPTPILIEVALPRPNPADQQKLFMVDSVDIALPAEDGCKSVEDEKRMMTPIVLPDDGGASPRPKAPQSSSEGKSSS